MKLKIIFPKREGDWFNNSVGRLAMPMPPTYLAALTPQDIEVSIADMMGGDTINFDDAVDLVAITVRTPVALTAYRIADEFRRRETPVVLGGPHVTTLPLEAKKHADAVVIGEAENVWGTLLNDFQKGALKEYYIGGPLPSVTLPGKYHHVPSRPQLEGIPQPRRDLLPRKRYRMDALFTSKGCPYSCTFCGTPWLFGSELRHRPIDEVVREIESLPGSYLNIDDTIFGAAHDNRYYYDLYGELARLPNKHYWTGEGPLAVLDFDKGEETVRRAADSGLFRLIIGIESVHGPSLKQAGAWRKLGLRHAAEFDSEKITKAIRTIQDYGIDLFAFFVIGFDADTPETLQKTLDFCLKTGIMPMITILSPTPDSPLYRFYESEGRLLPDLNWDDLISDKLVVEHPLMSSDEIRKAKDETLNKLYGLVPILQRVIRAVRRRPHPAVFFSSLFMQLGLRQGVKRGIMQ